jgi:SAM-dependent methyltransferase
MKECANSSAWLDAVEPPPDPPPIPLYLPPEPWVSTAVRRLLQVHAADLEALVRPLERISPDELAAIDGHRTAARVAAAWEANERTLHQLLLLHPQRLLALPPPGGAPETSPPPPTVSASYDGAAQLIAHLARDWGAMGAEARRRTHRPVLRALPVNATRVLVPGAGACRLAWELARRGHVVEASDVSAPMLLAAHSLIRRGAAAEPLPAYPFVRCEGGVRDREACLQRDALPDRRSAARLGERGRLTLQLADFAQYGNDSDASRRPFDALVTHYFVDTQADVAATVRLAHRLLAPGGRWVNFGPLQWHDDSAGLLRLTLAELVALVIATGFRVLKCRTLRRIPYLGRGGTAAGGGLLLSSSEGSSWHDVVFFVAERLPATSAAAADVLPDAIHC